MVPDDAVPNDVAPVLCLFQYGKPMTKEVYHNCHICGKDLLQQSKNLKKHVKHHNFTLEKYFEVYVKGGKVSQVNITEVCNR